MITGVVIIGRNEGERFERCLRSLLGRASPIVYVDSGSTDGSVAFAESCASHGVHVVRLDMSTPFTAARARNAGLERLLQAAPQTQFVQFVDGDCEVREGWLEAATATLKRDATLAAVSGRLRERFPEASLYNRLADLEWDRPVGEEKSCGGVAMMRVEAVQKASGFDPTLIAGEEPELCARMRAHSFRIWRLGDEMAWHDLAMTTKKQWLTRARRHGYAIVEVSYFKTAASRGLFQQQVRSAVLWGVVAPATVVLYVLVKVACLIGFAIVLANSEQVSRWAVAGGDARMQMYANTLLAARVMPVLAGIPVILVAIAWFMQTRKLARRAESLQGLSKTEARDYAALLMRSKLSQARGMLSFLLHRLRNRRAGLIDYRETK
ncbi:MAG TPA: glycosyltransferase family 2 protein [Phycisphaerales bacterium]|nr:glycosyltransferase family 2 protein [Phycisphaerales bacterium]